MPAPELHIDHERHEVFVNKKLLLLSPAQYRILVALKKKRVTLSREQLLEHVWEGDESFEKDARTIDQHVSRLRKRIARIERRVGFIETVPTFGYKYIGS